MRALPIVACATPALSPHEVRAAEQLAEALARERPSLRLDEAFRGLVPQRLEEGPSLHLDDLSEIVYLDADADVRFYQQRARLRAGEGDLVASTAPVPEAYETYCRQQLGLGQVAWLYPAALRNPLRIAEACWEDEQVRGLLLRRLSQGELQYLHPHMGTFAVWELAALLAEESRRPLKVIAPPPGVSAWINHKVAFCELATRLLGPASVPSTRSAWNLAMLVRRVSELAAEYPVIGIKLPNSCGGGGTLVLDAHSFRGKRAAEVRALLQPRLAGLEWNGETQLLVDRWETNILSSPSAQLWIPPPSEGEPVLEGLFTQLLEGETGMFVGSVSALLPPAVVAEASASCWRLALLLQHLGYVGRCSFDMLLVGQDFDHCRLEFIECNGRWGGTSAPMTLMNRLFGDWRRQPYINRVCQRAGLQDWTFAELQTWLGDRLYDRRSGQGRLILSLPGRMAARAALDVIALGETGEEALAWLEREFAGPMPPRSWKQVG